MEFEYFIKWLGLTVLILVGSIGVSLFFTTDSKLNLKKGFSGEWLYGFAWVISSIIAGIACTYLMMNS